MFKSIKSKLFMIIFIYSLILIFISFGTVLIYFNLQNNSTLNIENKLIYKIQNAEHLVEIYELDNFNDANLMESRNYLQENIFKINIAEIIKILIFIIIIIILMTLFLNYLYERKIKKLFSLQNKDISEYQQINKELSTKDEIISKSSADVTKVNNYIAHEIKNSLAVLEGKIKYEPETVSQYIQNMSHQIDDINALTVTDIKHVKIDFLLVIASVIDMFPENIELNFSEEEEYFVLGSEVLLQRAIYNIIENAYKFSATKVWINVYKKESNLICEIHNNGEPINTEEIDKIFQYTYRINQLKTNGYGIGLSLVKNVIEKLSGSIYVESKENVCFYISLKSLNK